MLGRCLGRRATDALTSSKLNAPGTYRKAQTATAWLDTEGTRPGEMPLSAFGASVSVQTSGGETCAVQRIEGWLQKLIFNVDEQVIICLGNQLERNTCVIEDMFDAK
jgi:hypothetical protein